MPAYRLIPLLHADSEGALQPPARLADGTRTLDAIEAARAYEGDGADALVFAAADSSPGKLAEACSGLVEAVSIPVDVRADFSELSQLEPILVAGTRRIVLGDSALDDPDLILEVVRELDPEGVAVEIRALRHGDDWRVVSGDGGETEWDAVTWARVVQAQGGSELVVGSASPAGRDGPFDLELLAAVVQEVDIPVLASGPAAGAEDVLDALMLGQTAGLLLGDLLSSGRVRIPALRAYLGEHGL